MLIEPSRAKLNEISIKIQIFFSNDSILKCWTFCSGFNVSNEQHLIVTLDFFQKLNMWQTFCSWLIICVNIKQIWLVFWKIPSDTISSRDRQTDRQKEGQRDIQRKWPGIPPQLHWWGYNECKLSYTPYASAWENPHFSQLSVNSYHRHS